MKRIWFSLFCLLVCVGCSDAILLMPRPSGLALKSAGEFCTQPPEKTNLYTKFMFIIDKSGSNVYGNLGGPPTDPKNIKRAGNIEKFWNTKKDDPFIKWSFIVFHTWQADSYIGPSDNPLFSNNPQDMSNAINLLRTNPDQKSTPYGEALRAAERAVKNDLKTHPDEDSQYVLFFVSDGYPDDGNVTHPVGPSEIAMVDSLMNAAKDKMYFSTAYYGPPDEQKAADGLKTMAEHGKGKFIDMNKTPDFKFDDLIVGGPTAETYFIKPGSFVVYNVNSAICFDNYMGQDSDGDGLCDKDEYKLGYPFDPQNRFSFGDGYGDYFHYADKTLIPCSDRTDLDNDLLTGCEESFMKNNIPVGTTKVMGDPKNPDTDGDGIIDGIEYFMLHIKSVALDSMNVLQDYDHEPIPMNAGLQIRQHRNPQFVDDTLPANEIYDTVYAPNGYSPEGQSCYTFRQDHLRTYPTQGVTSQQALGPLYGHPANGNVVLLHFIETLQAEPESPGVYMYSIQSVNNEVNAGLTVNDKVFSKYKVPKDN